MRFEADSCVISSTNNVKRIEEDNLPGMRGRYTYRSDGVGMPKSKWVEGLYEFAMNYMAQNGINPRHQELWDYVTTSWTQEYTMPVFYKNFEIMRVSFFLRTDVRKWHEALTEGGLFRVFRHGWGDENIKFLTLSMFAAPEWVIVKRHPGCRHGRAVCENYFRTIDLKL